MLSFPTAMRIFVAFLVLFLLPPALPARADDPPSLFGTKETKGASMKMFTKWTDAVQRSINEKSQQPGDCKDKQLNKCSYQEWRKFLDKEKGKPLEQMVKDVNQFMNKAAYITDPVNWGMDDYWTSPAEFLAKFGDCEDYAIAKFMSLKDLGVPPDSMRIVVVNDLNLKIGHAILAVYTGNKILLLDNQIPQVVDAGTVKHYEPLFSINESAWWRHLR